MYEVINSEPGLWTVGFRRPDRRWEPESDHGSEREAKQRARDLNGVECRFVYLRSEPGLWTVGEFRYDTWWSYSDHDSDLAAAGEVMRLNA